MNAVDRFIFNIEASSLNGCWPEFSGVNFWFIARQLLLIRAAMAERAESFIAAITARATETPSVYALCVLSLACETAPTHLPEKAGPPRA